MSETNNSDPRGSRKIDLSTGKRSAAKKKAKGFSPVVQQTINLSTPKPDRVEEEPQPRPVKIPAQKSEKKGDPNLRSKGNSLADLLDPETLAKLRAGNQH